jgi:cytoplasmic iron level regulating protein YaaA (DUF328/UPF0246 family)
VIHGVHASVSAVYVLLPPSETKSTGGTGPELDLCRLSFPLLTPTREALLRSLESGPAAATGPTEPALQRYTGVLYSAFDVQGLTRAENARAEGRVLICSALFGLLSAPDPIPFYKFSAGSRLPGLPTVPALWREPLAAALAAIDGPVLDLRSGAYAAFAPAHEPITARVVTVTRSGETKPVSHANKSIKGVLARLVATTRADVQDVSGLLRVARRAGLSVSRTGPASIDLIAPPAH